MHTVQKFGNWACVAGAAEGLGAAFATRLASRGSNLILIDQKEETLENLAAELRSQYGVTIELVKCDLENSACIDPIMQQLKKYQVRFLIYNAAYGPVRPFLDNTPEQLRSYLRINMETPLHLAHRFCKLNQEQTAGMLWLSSLAGFRGTQLVIPYAGTKAFSWNVAEGLHYEFKNTGLEFSVCCAGTTDTPGFRFTNPKPFWLSPKPMAPEAVAKEALHKFGKRIFIFPGTGNKISHFLLCRVLPRPWASRLHNYVMGKTYK